MQPILVQLVLSTTEFSENMAIMQLLCTGISRCVQESKIRGAVCPRKLAGEKRWWLPRNKLSL
jgi:hypothetical protein